ncbi:MAG: exodeoxyribonuclease V subunit gamma [Spirochaetes bacterium]|nr:exodeoxyribonuclease V subunit gamma [Spirochaetota bacterium]
MGIKLYYSNLIENLSDKFISEISAFADPFNPPVVIIPNPYLKKWLQLKMSLKNGISPNINFNILDDGLWKIMGLLFGPDDLTLLKEDRLALLIYALITGGSKELLPLNRYLVHNAADGKPSAKKAWQLSARLSRYFLSYELYREPMTESWLSGAGIYGTEMEKAQSYLYLELFKEKGLRDRILPGSYTVPQLWKKKSGMVRAGKIKPANRRQVPEIFFFGKSQLSPFHVKMIYGIGAIANLSIFQINPCAEFWEDATTPAEDRWKRLRSTDVISGDDGDDLAEAEFENKLLKLWGKTARENLKLFSLLEEKASEEYEFISEWLYGDQNREPSTVLEHLQSQILFRKSFIEGSRVNQDKTIQIISCPDIFREVEGVYNSILCNLEHDSGLNMNEIAVMTPDIDRYSSVIKSVFSREPHIIDYSIIDATAGRESLYGKAVISLLNLAAGNFSRSEIFGLFTNACFQEKFGFTGEDVEYLLILTDSLNIHNSYNSIEKTAVPSDSNTWLFGLRRLRLGRIMNPHDSSNTLKDYKGILPYPDPYSNPELIGRFSSAIDLLHVKLTGLRDIERTSGEWADISMELLNEFLAVPAAAPGEKAIRDSLIEKIEAIKILDAENSKKSMKMEFIADYITDGIASLPANHAGYLFSGINISAMIPKRQIPFKIIYLLGMEEGIFPGEPDYSTLDLKNIRRTIGDITRIDADKYIFLETIISTREKLYISYVSKDLKRDKDFFLNSPVTQLAAYLNEHILSENIKQVGLPATGYSIKHLEKDPGESDYSDFVIMKNGSSIDLVNYSVEERKILITLRSFLDNARGPDDEEIKTDEGESPLNRFFQGRLKKNEARTPDKIIRLGIKDLSLFLYDPAVSFLRFHLGIFDRVPKDPTTQDDEPFFSGRGVFYGIASMIFDKLTDDGTDKFKPSQIIDEYRNYSLSGDTPSGEFQKTDMKKIASEIRTTFSSSRIKNFIDDKKALSFYKNIGFGSSANNPGFPSYYQSTDIPVKITGEEKKIEISGSLQHLWINPETGAGETLVLHHSDRPRIRSLLSQYLFFLSIQSGIIPDLSGVFNSNKFTINLAGKTGIWSIDFDISPDTARNTLITIIKDLLETAFPEMLPLELIASEKELNLSLYKSGDKEADRMRFAETLSSIIDEETGMLFAKYNPANLVRIINPDVHWDALDRVTRRCGIILESFYNARKNKPDES